MDQNEYFKMIEQKKQFPKIYEPEELDRKQKLEQQQSCSIISKDLEIALLKKEIKFLKDIIENQNKLISRL